MERKSKNNPYECPECGHKTTRRWNMKIHLEKVHGYVPFLPERTVEEWVYEQLHTLARRFVEAELANEIGKKDSIWQSMLSLYRYHRDLFPITHIMDVIKEVRQSLKRK
jgi:hypothetical protein